MGQSRIRYLRWDCTSSYSARSRDYIDEKRSRKGISTYVDGRDWLMALELLLGRWLLLWSLLTLRFTHLPLYFRSSSQSIALNTIGRLSLSHYIALFRRFLRYFALSSRFYTISKAYWWLVHRAWAQNQPQEGYMRYYSRLSRHRAWQWAHEDSFTQKEVRTCYTKDQINFEAIFSFAYRVTITSRLSFFRRQDDDIKQNFSSSFIRCSSY